MQNEARSNGIMQKEKNIGESLSIQMNCNMHYHLQSTLTSLSLLIILFSIFINVMGVDDDGAIIYNDCGVMSLWVGDGRQSL